MYIYIYIYTHTYIWYPPPSTYHFSSFKTQGWVGTGGSGMERRPENANFLGLIFINIYIYIYTYTYISVYMCTYIYICIYTHRAINELGPKRPSFHKTSIYARSNLNPKP